MVTVGPRRGRRHPRVAVAPTARVGLLLPPILALPLGLGFLGRGNSCWQLRRQKRRPWAGVPPCAALDQSPGEGWGGLSGTGGSSLRRRGPPTDVPGLPEARGKAGLPTVCALTLDTAPAAVTGLAAEWPPPVQASRGAGPPTQPRSRAQGPPRASVGPLCGRGDRAQEAGACPASGAEVMST